MPIFIATLLVTTILFPSCSVTTSSRSSTWSIQMNTSGGLTGRGNGNVVIDSQGQIVYEKPDFPNKQSPPCKGSLSDDDLRELKTAVDKTKPEGWKIAGLAVAAPDAFGYHLTLRREKETYEVEWYDNTSEKLPADIKALYTIIGRLRDQQAKKCDRS